MQGISRSALGALACLFAAAAVAPLPVAAQETTPGTVLLWRHMFGTIDGARWPTGGVIYSIGDDGSNLRQLTPRKRGVFNIPNLFEWPANAFSPSGHYSVFLQEQSDLAYPEPAIHGKYLVMDAQGQHTWPLFPGADDLQAPGYGSVTWGPAGTNEIAYANAADNHPHAHPACIRLMHPNGTGDHTLWCASRWDHRAIEGIRWSGDGRKLLAYAVLATQRNGMGADLYLIDTQTGAATLIEQNANMPKNGGAIADLSYDGHMVVYQIGWASPDPCNPHTGSPVWCAKNMSTGHTIPLSDPENQVWDLGNHVALSPDGSKMVVDAQRTGAPQDLELYVINTDGTGLRKITDPCVDNYQVGTYLLWTPIRFSPDGKQVLANCEYSANQYPPPPDTGPRKIYVVNPADGTSRFVTYGTAYDWHVPSM